jgi:hypothetical protein
MTYMVVEDISATVKRWWNRITPARPKDENAGESPVGAGA